MMKINLIGVGILLFVHGILFFNSRFTVWPEMILYPWLFNKGYKLYENIINPYFPLLLILMGGFFKLLPLSILSLKVFAFLLLIFSDLVIFFGSFFVSKDSRKALISLITYIFLQYSFGGIGLWFELALTPFLLLGLLLIYYSKKVKYMVLASVLIMIAVGIKQNTGLFYIPILLLFFAKRRYQDMLIFLVINFFGLLLMVGYLYSIYILDDFISWAILLPITYSSHPGFVLLPSLRQYLLIVFPFFVCFGLRPLKSNIYWILCFLIATSFAFPRYEDFHLQVVIALAAFFVIKLKRIYLYVFLILTFLIFIRNLNNLWMQEDRFLDKDMYQLTDKIKEYNSVYLLNSPELAYFFADKLPPKIWATNFPWYFKHQGFEEKFISNFDDQNIEYVVIGDKIGGGKSDLGSYYPERLYEFILANYKYEERFNNFNIYKLK